MRPPPRLSGGRGAGGAGGGDLDLIKPHFIYFLLCLTVALLQTADVSVWVEAQPDC